MIFIKMARKTDQIIFSDIEKGIKVSYYVASIIPLSVLVFFSLKYIYPYVIYPDIQRAEVGSFVTTVIILLLTVLISILGYFVSVRATNKSIDSVQDAYAQLNSVVEVTRFIADSRYVDELLDSIVKSATELLHAQFGALLVVDDRGVLWYKSIHGKEGNRVKDRSVRKGEGIVGKVFESGTPIAANDVSRDERFSPLADAVPGLPLSSILCVPVIYENQSIGVIKILNGSSSQFDAADEKLAMGFATQASLYLAENMKRESQSIDVVNRKENFIIAMDKIIPMKKGHAKRVAQYADSIGKHLNLEREMLTRLHTAAELHDMGLLRFGYFEQWEERKYKIHPIIAYDMLRPLSSWHDVALDILFHHERYDGTGYPTGKKGEEIPMNARIVAVADTYDVLTSRISYKEIKSQEEAIAEIEKNAGTQFDPHVVSAFKTAFCT
jgi:putative methionine-R-sulfoxide reductase with GAF domain